jgi:hypothetical protein
LAIPLMAGFLGVLAMGFWIGWTILTIKTAPTVAEPPPPAPSQGEKQNPDPSPEQKRSA